MSYDCQNWLTWGYFLLRVGGTGVPEFAGCQLTAANGGAVIPDYDCIPNGQGLFDVAIAARRMAVSEAAAQEIYRYNGDVFQRGNLIFHHPRYTGVAEVVELKRRYFAGDDRWCAVGVCFEFAEMTQIAGYQPLPPLAKGGVVIGYDLYGILGNGSRKVDFASDFTGFGCPFRHSDIDRKISAGLGIDLTLWGLLPDTGSARRMADYVNLHQVGEPEYYLPFGLVKYDI